jgi:hypothetical protein
MSGPQSRFGHGGEEKNSQPFSGLEPPIIQPVAQRVSLSYPGSWIKRKLVWNEHYVRVPIDCVTSNLYGVLPSSKY